MVGKEVNWGSSVVYQVYLSTFFEGSRYPQRGIGSLRGVQEKLDYLLDIGVTAVWLSPFYETSWFDAGYDVIDMTKVDEQFGSMADFDSLLAAVHERGMRIMIDYIPNHTSSQHQWFIESQKSKTNQKSDWYIWADPIIDSDGRRRPPTNWASVFSISQLDRRRRGELNIEPHEKTPPISAWTWCDDRQQYYLHSFSRYQPDLNWAHPPVRHAMKQILRFWLDKGVDGFRCDAVNYLGKNIIIKDGKYSLLDEEPSDDYAEGVDNPYDQLKRQQSCNDTRSMTTYLKDIVSVMNEEPYKKRDISMIFEAYVTPDGHDLINNIDAEKASSFNFTMMGLPWDAKIRKQQLDKYYQTLPSSATANHVSGNHDKPRLALQRGVARARAIYTYSALLPGTIYVYNGEELGMEDSVVPHERLKDLYGFRDSCRVPVPWDDSLAGGGFSRAPLTNWYLPPDKKNSALSVTLQQQDSTSTLSLYRAVAKLRREFCEAYYPVNTVDNELLLFISSGEKLRQALVIVNFSSLPKTVRLDREYGGELILSSIDVEHRKGQPVHFSYGFMLQPYEAIVVKQDKI